MAVEPGIIDQSISAGGQWDGTVPSGDPVDSLGIRTFPAAATGGLFELPWIGSDSSYETYIIDKIMVDFGLSGTNSVAVKNAGGDSYELASPGAGLYIFTGPLEMVWDEKIEITSNTSANAMSARVHGRPGRLRPASF